MKGMIKAFLVLQMMMGKAKEAFPVIQTTAMADYGKAYFVTYWVIGN